MFEWVKQLEDYLNQLATNIDGAINNLNSLIDQVNSYIQLSTYYYYISGFFLFFLFISNLVILRKLTSLSEEHSLVFKELEVLKSLREGEQKNE